MKPRDQVNLKKLKIFALENLRENSRLRKLLLLDDEELAPEEFLVKLDVWLKLLKMEHH